MQSAQINEIRRELQQIRDQVNRVLDSLSSTAITSVPLKTEKPAPLVETPSAITQPFSNGAAPITPKEFDPLIKANKINEAFNSESGSQSDSALSHRSTPEVQSHQQPTSVSSTPQSATPVSVTPQPQHPMAMQQPQNCAWKLCQRLQISILYTSLLQVCTSPSLRSLPLWIHLKSSKCVLILSTLSTKLSLRGMECLP